METVIISWGEVDNSKEEGMTRPKGFNGAGGKTTFKGRFDTHFVSDIGSCLSVSVMSQSGSTTLASVRSPNLRGLLLLEVASLGVDVPLVEPISWSSEYSMPFRLANS